MPTWLLPSLLTGGLTLLLSALAAIWAEIKASEARQNKRIDELREDLKELRRDQKETRQKVDELPMKILELLRTSKQPVTGER